MAERAVVLRRLIHVSLALSLVYYLVPDPLPLVRISKGSGVLVLVGIVTVAEAIRLKRGWRFFLFRDYEMKRPAAYYQLGVGCAAALVAFPMKYAILTILGVCFADPVIGIVRAGPKARWAFAAGFGVWVAAAIIACAALTLPVPIGLIVLGAAAAVAVEPIRFPTLDDDLTMNLVPLVLITLVGAALPA